MDELEKIQAWYRSECDGDWEHSFGIDIVTLDNPGWIVTIDLAETVLESKPFDTISRGDSEADADWIHCKVQDRRFIASGGVFNLKEILHTFLSWSAG